MPEVEVVPLVEEGLGNSSYLLDLGDGRALAVDPGRDPAPYLAEAERRRWSVAFSLETHLHADFVSGSRELAEHGAGSWHPPPPGSSSPRAGWATATSWTSVASGSGPWLRQATRPSIWRTY